MQEASRVHLTFVFDEAAVPELARQRHRWDPLMATGVPPHITLVYPEEFGDEDLLVERAQRAASKFGPFTMRTSALITDGDEGSAGVFASVSDPSGSWLALRQSILQHPFKAIDIAPHITVVHPRTSRHGAEAWRELGGLGPEDDLIVREFSLTSTNREVGMMSRRVFQLDGEDRQLCAAVILVDGKQVLLGLRAADRLWYPNVWDFVGGRIEADEDAHAAACREAREELGVTVARTDLRYVETLVTDDAEVVVFAASTWLGEPRNMLPGEHQEIAWFDPGAVDGLAISHPRLGLVSSQARSIAESQTGR